MNRISQTGNGVGTIGQEMFVLLNYLITTTCFSLSYFISVFNKSGSRTVNIFQFTIVKLSMAQTEKIMSGMQSLSILA